jgi:hypothetical protein
MFRFTIRDVLWLMVVVGIGLGWWTNRQQFRHTIEHITACCLLPIKGNSKPIWMVVVLAAFSTGFTTTG